MSKGTTIGFKNEDYLEDARKFSRLRGFSTFSGFVKYLINQDMRANNYKPFTKFENDGNT